MGLTDFAREERRTESLKRLNGSPSLMDDNDLSLLLGQFQAVIKTSVKEGVRESLLEIPGVSAVLWIKNAERNLKLKLTRMWQGLMQAVKKIKIS